MSNELTFNEVLEIKELLSFKIASNIKSELFLEIHKGEEFAERLKKDIEQSAREICDLEDLVTNSSH
jgi:hypothetical protein